MTLDLVEDKPHSRWRIARAWSDIYQAFIQRKPAIFGAVLLSIIIILAFAAPYIAPHSPTSQKLSLSLAPPFWHADSNPDYPLGSDHFGRDVLSRLLYGAQVSLRAGGFAALFAMVVGVFLGIVSGYWGGWTENVIMRIVDVFLAFPLILLALSLASILGPSLRNIIIVMALTGWMMYARVIRSAVLSMKDREFIAAAVAIGVPAWRIQIMHILPNVIAPSIVLFTFSFAQFIILESALSFLGLGVPPPAPSWGRMLYDGRDFLTTAWWLSTFPGICIMVTALCLNFIGDGLRDALDPHLRNIT